MIFWITKYFIKMCISYFYNKIQAYFSSKFEFHIWSSYRFNTQKYFSLIWYNSFLDHTLINFFFNKSKIYNTQIIIIKIRKVIMIFTHISFAFKNYQVYSIQHINISLFIPGSTLFILRSILLIEIQYILINFIIDIIYHLCINFIVISIDSKSNY